MIPPRYAALLVWLSGCAAGNCCQSCLDFVITSKQVRYWFQ